MTLTDTIRRVYVGTNKGSLVGVSTESPSAAILWTIETHAPVFSSPIVNSQSGMVS